MSERRRQIQAVPIGQQTIFEAWRQLLEIPDGYLKTRGIPEDSDTAKTVRALSLQNTIQDGALLERKRAKHHNNFSPGGPQRYGYWKCDVYGGSTWVFRYYKKKMNFEPDGRSGYLVQMLRSETPSLRNKQSQPIIISPCPGRSFYVVKWKTFQRRWRARDQAYRWYCRKKGIPFHSLHTKRTISEETRKRLEVYRYEFKPKDY